ncbi:ead/Ea22-like family protein [Pseudocitrobacter faecalis]|uniref:Ead/Ea22-like protein n=1 Tax=Pseudocitrobacter faecalis TaxID=1398493 RepID=A0ABX9FXK9_9ENTR|nr:hypothetical protein DFQ50_104377 [Pseudocitrobacter faecalis]
MSMTTELAQIKCDIEARKAMPGFGPDTSIERLRIINATQKSFSLETVEALVEALKASKQDAAKWFKAFEKAVSVGARYEERIAELEESHSKLRETLAGIHNTIRTDGSYTPLAAILNAAKRAHEESAAAAGVAVEGE